MKLRPNGAVLAWAREIERKSLNDVSASTGAPVDVIKKWESGEVEVTLANLQLLSTLYKRPVSFFFLDKTPTEKLITPEFRTFDSVKVDDLSSKTIFALRKSKYNRKLYRELLEDLKEEYVFDFPKAKVDSDPEHFAKLIRKRLEIPDDVHHKLRSKNAALRYWINALENKGLLVFQYSLPERGFCLGGKEGLPPAVILSSVEEPSGRSFTLFHELAHLLIQINSTTHEHAYVEKFCNHFAGAFLVPEKVLYDSRSYQKYTLSYSDFWLVRIAGEFKVSADVVLRRLLILKKITSEFYDKKIAEIKANRNEKEMRKANEKKDGFLPPATRSFLNTGLAMSSKLFEAKERGIIGTTQLVRSFQTTSHSLPDIRAALLAAKNLYVD
jgi:Zn-dependent peptidase ImmA (M78 family)